MQKHVMPEVGVFLSKQLQAQQKDTAAPSKASAGVLPLTSQQATLLEVRSHTQLSPYLEMCCLRVSANVSYQHAEEDVELFTGIRVAAKTQQRLVHRQTFEEPEVEQSVEELSVDGGKIRIRTPQGEPCTWLEYKGVTKTPDKVDKPSFELSVGVRVGWLNGLSTLSGFSLGGLFA